MQMAPSTSSSTEMYNVSFNNSSIGTTTADLDLTEDELHDYLLSRNLGLVRRLAPTLAYLALLIVGGLVGNSLVFVVYFKRYKPSAMRTFILAMCVGDLMINCLALPGDVAIVTYHFTMPPAACKTIMTVTGTTLFYSAYLLVGVSVDRYIKICRPTARQTSKRGALITVLSFAGVSIVCGIPLPILYGAHFVQLPYEDHNATVHNVTGVTCSIATDWVESKLNAFFSYFIGIALFIVIIIMAVCYSSIARTLWLHRKQNQTVLAGSQRDRKRNPLPPLPQAHEDNSTNTSQETCSTNPSSGTDSPTMKRQVTELHHHCNTGLGDKSAKEHLVKETDLTTPTSTPQSSPSPARRNPSPCLKKTMRSRVPASRVKKIPKSTTLMMFVLTALFVINFVPFSVVKFVQKGRDVIGQSDAILNAVYIAFRSRFMNSAVNPIVYSFCSARFRQECVHLLTRR